MEITSQEKLLCAIAKILSDLDIEYLITGGMTVSVWGRPRSTVDIDIIVKLTESKAVLLTEAFKKISKLGYADKEMAKESVRSKGEFNFIDADSGLKVDFWVTKGDERSLSEFKNKRLKRIRNQDIYFSSPEDLILSKLLWQKQGGGEKHIEDARSIVAISVDKINREYLKKQALNLDILEDLDELFEKKD